MCLGLVIYALKTKEDFTICGGFMYILITFSLFLAIVQIFI
jgi:hypothetical protein